MAKRVQKIFETGPVREDRAQSRKRFTSEKEDKSERRMPWLPEATKDVVSCDKARGSANRT